MTRQLIAFILVCFAFAFACATLTAVRWPSLMMLTGFLAPDGDASAYATANWRELGITHGGAYFIAAFSVYAAATMLSRGREGALTPYLFGCLAGFGCLFGFDLAPGWWTGPGETETRFLAAAGLALCLAPIIAHLSSPAEDADEDPDLFETEQEALDPIQTSVAVRRARRLSPAIAHQRALYAAQGRRQRAVRRATGSI